MSAEYAGMEFDRLAPEMGDRSSTDPDWDEADDDYFEGDEPKEKTPAPGISPARGL